jgi:3-hydroxypropanoate dehydrogenase
MADHISAAALDQLFLAARTQNKWLPKDVPDATLREIIEIMKFGPTSANNQPARFVFVKSEAAKQRLAAHASEGNRPKIMQAPICTIIANDLEFYENLPRTFPHRPQVKDNFVGKPALIEETAFRNATLQGAYFMLAVRAVGLDVGAMSGFNNAAVDQEFFAGTSWRSNFLCNIGYGDPSGVMQRLPRLTFEEYAKVI